MVNGRGSRFSALFLHFLKSEKTGGLILILCTLLSLWISNSPVGDSYVHFWNSRLDLSFGGLGLNFTIEEWINDGMMSLFFFMVGLEIERELYVGELADFRNALLPVLAAIGGMFFPALIHFLLNHGLPTQPGIGIPMATDIAFSLGILSLLGKRVPPALKIFLAALAILDDLGAVILIAIFYTKDLSLLYLFAALGIFLLLLLLNRLNFYRVWIFLLLGIIMWYFMLKSGVHATVSGVLLAFAIPFKKDPRQNPSFRLQHALHMPVNYLVVPVFALANTGINLQEEWHQHLATSNNIGIMAGLVLGKPAGIVLICLLAVKMRFCRLPETINWKLLLGTGSLAGIGFTMSIFITNLAFPGQEQVIDNSKMAVLLASLVAAVAGTTALLLAAKKKKEKASS